ncbi:MAG: hypothetical protein H0X31_00440 [Nostocaceae cyanobacterium]|nr:hypothetical protein [Nostocaceae cyanobacterium]
MNLLITRTILQCFDSQVQNAKGARLQAVATTQELIFTGFSQPLGWSLVLSFHLAKHSKELAITEYLSFLEVINSSKLIYKNNWLIQKKALLNILYSRPPP